MAVKGLKIGNVTLENNIFLAPMAGVTDLPFRCICKEKGCGLVYTEMVSAKGMKYGNENTKDLLRISEKELPIAAQIFGSEPEVLALMARNIEDYPFAIIDINMGCPAPKIVKNGEGSALMKNPKLVGEIVKAVSMATKKPVTVKIRKGFDKNNENAVEIAKIAEENGAVAITVHGRTTQQHYSGQADWEIIEKVKRSVSIPVIGNGDVTTPQAAKNMLTQTGCDAIMVGRGAEGNPWIFEQINYFLQHNELLEEPSEAEKIETALTHGKMLVNYKGEFIGVREMRKHISWYIKGAKGASEMRVKINKAQSFNEIESILSTM